MTMVKNLGPSPNPPPIDFSLYMRSGSFMAWEGKVVHDLMSV